MCSDNSLSLAETASALGELKMYQNREDVEKKCVLLLQNMFSYRSLSLAETASALGELKIYQNREDVEKNVFSYCRICSLTGASASPRQ